MMLFWLILVPSIIGYIWGVRRVAWLLVYNVNGKNLRGLEHTDIAMGVFLGTLIGWTFPLLILYSGIQKITRKVNFRWTLDHSYRIFLSQPKSYEPENL